MQNTNWSPETVLGAPGVRNPVLSLEVLEETDSTNLQLLQQARDGAPHGKCLLALRQTAGRGRQGRRWLSDEEGSLTFSLLWLFAKPAAQLSGLPLVVTLALIQALEPTGVDGLALKWPNDLLRHGRKVAGVLVELTRAPNGETAAVLGIGLNVSLKDALADQISMPATDLRDAEGHVPARPALLRAILGQLCTLLPTFSEAGFTPFMQEYWERSALRGRRVRLILPSQQVETGECAGISHDGALLLHQQGRLNTFHGGEISLRTA